MHISSARGRFVIEGEQHSAQLAQRNPAIYCDLIFRIGVCRIPFAIICAASRAHTRSLYMYMGLGKDKDALCSGTHVTSGSKTLSAP